jgi:hypothetical protein
MSRDRRKVGRDRVGERQGEKEGERGKTEEKDMEMKWIVR